MVLKGEEGLECDICVDGIRLEHVSEFKSGTYEVECRRKVASGRKVVGAIRSLANARGMQLKSARALHEALLKPIIM